METLHRYSDWYAFSKFFFITIHIFECFVMLISVSLYDLFLQVHLCAALCSMATPHLERARSNYTARVVCLPTAF